MDEDENICIRGTYLDDCIVQMVKDKKIEALIDMLQIMAKKNMTSPTYVWLNAFELILFEGTEEQCDQITNALSTIGRGYRWRPYLRKDTILRLIKTRGLDWLHRMLKLVDIDSPIRLWAYAIEDEYDHLESLPDIIFKDGKQFLTSENYALSMIRLISGCEGSISKLEKWVPDVLCREFLNDKPLRWERCMDAAIENSDFALAEVLLHEADNDNVADYVLQQLLKYPGRKEHPSYKDLFLRAMDMASVELRRKPERERKKAANSYLRNCALRSLDPDPVIMAYLHGPSTKAVMP